MCDDQEGAPLISVTFTAQMKWGFSRHGKQHGGKVPDSAHQLGQGGSGTVPLLTVTLPCLCSQLLQSLALSLWWSAKERLFLSWSFLHSPLAI